MVAENYVCSVSAHDERLLSDLKPVRIRTHVAKCMDGTREDILGEIHGWLSDNGAPNILWLSGSPGAGKTAIAATLVSNLREEQRLGSFFSSKRGDADRGDPASLWRTVAYDLTRFNSALRKEVLVALTSGKVDTAGADIESHFWHLIQRPLKNTEGNSSRLPVVVVDALDECDPQSESRTVLLGTLRNWSLLSPAYKLLITSRDEVDISMSLEGPCRHIELHTGALVSSQSSDDIRRFLTLRFGEIAKQFPQSLPPTWPGGPIIEQLTERATGLFIWADTLTKFVRQDDPVDQLDLVLAGKLGSDIDALYRRILEISFRDPSKTLLKAFQMVVGTILLAKIPLRRDVLKNLLGNVVKETTMDVILNRLRSVISGRHDDLLRVSHQSFADFLGDPTRCPKTFAIDWDEQNRSLSLACLQLMNDKTVGLKFNICGLETSYLPNDSVHDLEARIKTHIPNYLLYACRFWTAHIQGSPEESPDLCRLLRYFLHNCLLHWLEVLSLINEISIAPKALLVVESWIGVSLLMIFMEDIHFILFFQDYDNDLAAFATDARKFVDAFHSAISTSAPHIYLSALAFAPTESQISKHFSRQYHCGLSATLGRTISWPAMLNIIDGHTHFFYSVAFSPTGKYLASGSHDSTVRVWHPETGKMISNPWCDPKYSVSVSIAFSPDEKFLLSGSLEGRIRMWDIKTGKTTSGTFEGHTNSITSIAFSPDGKSIVSGSHDRTIRLWNASTGNVVSGPCEHPQTISSVMFLPGGKYIMSGSIDGTICMWDAKLGRLSLRALEHAPLEGYVSLSPDGKRVVSGSSEGTIHLWDTNSGNMLYSPVKAHTGRVTSAIFSHDGTHVVSGSEDGTVCIWDTETGEIVSGPFKGHTSEILSVGISPDGKRLVSSSFDFTLRIWDAKVGKTALGPLEEYDHDITSVAISPDGNCVVSGSQDGMIGVWSVHTGKMTSDPFRGHGKCVTSIVFSPDGTCFVSGSEDTTVCIWDAKTGKLLSDPFEGHTNSVISVGYSSDGEQVASGSVDGTICVWYARTGKMAGPFEVLADPITCLAFSSDGKSVVSGSSDRTVRVWDIQTGNITSGPFEGHTHWISSVAFLPNGKHVVSTGRDRTVRVWDTKTGKIASGSFEGHSLIAFSRHGECVLSNLGNRTIPEAPLQGNSDRPVTRSSDGRFAITSSENGELQVVAFGTGEMVCGPFEGHTHSITSSAFSHAGDRIVSGSCDRTARVWNIQTGKSIFGPFQAHTDWVTSVKFSFDGQRIVSGSQDGTIFIWEAETGKIIAGPFEGRNEPVTALALSPDGKRVVSGSDDGFICMWDVGAGKVAWGPFKGHEYPVLQVDFSLSGEMVFSSDSDTEPREWNAETGKMECFTHDLLALSPDGKLIVSCIRDKILAWDAQTGKCVSGPFEGHSGWITSFALSPDGKRVVSGSRDRTIRVWDNQPDQSTECSRLVNGWICNSNSELLFWVPPSSRRGLWRPMTVAVMGTPVTNVDISEFKHGPSWTSCQRKLTYHLRIVHELSPRESGPVDS